MLEWMYPTSLRWIPRDLRGATFDERWYRYNEFSYLATASLYTNPAVARLTTSKHKSEPSILKEKRNIETQEYTKHRRRDCRFNICICFSCCIIFICHLSVVSFILFELLFVRALIKAEWKRVKFAAFNQCAENDQNDELCNQSCITLIETSRSSYT